MYSDKIMTWVGNQKQVVRLNVAKPKEPSIGILLGNNQSNASTIDYNQNEKQFLRKYILIVLQFGFYIVYRDYLYTPAVDLLALPCSLLGWN